MYDLKLNQKQVKFDCKWKEREGRDAVLYWSSAPRITIVVTLQPSTS